MKKKLLLLPLFLLVLAACGPSTSSEPDSTPGTSQPGTSQPGTSVTSEDDSLPPPPSSSEEPAPDSMTISQIRDIPLNTTGGLDAGQIKEVRTTGTVTNVARRASGNTYNVTIQDGEEAMLLYAITEEKIAEFGVPGDLLTVDGTLAPYKSLWELSGVKVVTKAAGTAVTPKTLTSVAQTALVGLDSVLVKIEGLSYVSGEVVADTSADNLMFKLGEDNIAGYLHYAIPTDIQAAIAAALVPTGDADSKIDTMDTLTFTGILDMNAGTYQLAITGADNFTNVTDGGEPVAPTVFDSVSTIRAGMKAGTLVKNDVVNFEGVVTSNDYNGIIIQETNGTTVSAIALRGVTNQATAAVKGNLVRGTGTIDIYNGLAQIGGVGTNLEVVSPTGTAQGSVEITEALLADANLVDNTNALIRATGLTATADINLTASANVVLKKGATDFAIRYDSRYNDATNVVAKLNLLKTGYTLEIQEGGAFLSWFNAPQSYLIDASKLIVRDTEGTVVGGSVDPDPISQIIYKLDLSNAAAITATSLASGYYSYSTSYLISVTDGTTTEEWSVIGFNTNSFAVAGVRFGGKNTLPVASSLLNKPADLSDTLNVPNAVSTSTIVGTANTAIIKTLGTFGTAGVCEKVYVQSSTSADFSAGVVDLGNAVIAADSTLTINFLSAQTDVFYRVIFAQTGSTSNSGIIVSSVSFENIVS